MTLTSQPWEMLRYSTLPFIIWIDNSISFILSAHQVSKCSGWLRFIRLAKVHMVNYFNHQIISHTYQMNMFRGTIYRADGAEHMISVSCYSTNISFLDESKLLMAFYFVCLVSYLCLFISSECSFSCFFCKYRRRVLACGHSCQPLIGFHLSHISCYGRLISMSLD